MKLISPRWPRTVSFSFATLLYVTIYFQPRCIHIFSLYRIIGALIVKLQRVYKRSA